MTAILLDHFYKIVSLHKENSTITACVTFDVQHQIFNGHFPDMPIVPGVCQTQMLGEVLNQALSADLQLRNAATIKFLSVVDPTITPSLDLTINYTRNDEGAYNISAQYKCGDTVFFKFKGSYAST